MGTRTSSALVRREVTLATIPGVADERTRAVRPPASPFLSVRRVLELAHVERTADAQQSGQEQAEELRGSAQDKAQEAKEGASQASPMA